MNWREPLRASRKPTGNPSSTSGRSRQFHPGSTSNSTLIAAPPPRSRPAPTSACVDARQTPSRVCGITHLGDIDLATEKLLASADGGLDAAIFSRDVIDLAMMRATRTLVQRAITKAELAYGASIKRDLKRSIDQLLNKKGWVERCIDSMAVTAPKADLLQRVIKLGRQAGLACKPRLS